MNVWKQAELLRHERQWARLAASRPAPSKRAAKAIGKAIGQKEISVYPKIVSSVRKGW